MTSSRLEALKIGKPCPETRVFLNLWFAKPMVWVRVAFLKGFHEKDGNHENDENDEDNSDSYKQGVECWIRGNHGNHDNDENHENPGCKPRVPQTTGLEIPAKHSAKTGATWFSPPQVHLWETQWQASWLLLMWGILPIPGPLLARVHCPCLTPLLRYHAYFLTGLMSFLGADFWAGDPTKHFSVKKKGFSEKGGGVQWMRGLVRISTGKAIQWRGPGHSVNCRTPKIEKLLSKSTSQKSAPKNFDIHGMSRMWCWWLVGGWGWISVSAMRMPAITTILGPTSYPTIWTFAWFIFTALSSWRR